MAPAAETDGTKFLLQERIKEMRCMYGLSNLIAAGKEARSTGAGGGRVQVNPRVDPPAWLHPEITSAHLTMVNDLSDEIATR